MSSRRAEIEAAGLLDGLADDRAREDRAVLVEQLLADGFTVEEVRDAARRGRLPLLPLDRVLHPPGVELTSVDVAERSGLSLDFLTRLWRALGLAETADDEVAYAEADVEAARTLAPFLEAGLDPESLVLIGQVLGHGMGRLAETIREVVGNELLRAGDSEQALGLRYAQAAEHLVPLLNPLLGYVLNVHLKEQVKTDVVLEAELVTGRVEGARPIAVCFADLVGFTRLGERVPPDELSAAGRRLTAMAVDVARPPVRLVKMIGDAAMLVSPQPEPLLNAALDLVDAAETDPAVTPLRVGVASGDAIVHCGDWLGAPVNLASRVTDAARPGSVLATSAVRRTAEPAFAWSWAGRRRFKGVRDEVGLYRVRRGSD
ncbi:MAG TPA: adenylate cyclase regulatory domain-containing protein [Thermoleophilaceae bacterium]|nr:adenylate cyclase regulatory domain-containing protein [Thermoleophilaceae bacterium]